LRDRGVSPNLEAERREARSSAPPRTRLASRKERIMRFMGWNLLFATWLLISAFVVPHTAFSQATTWVAAVAIGAAAMLAVGRPAARFAISGIAVFLALVALLLPGMSTAAAVNNAVVAALLFALSVVRPTRVAAEAKTAA
jgi:hypothetical protein